MEGGWITAPEVTIYAYFHVHTLTAGVVNGLKITQKCSDTTVCKHTLYTGGTATMSVGSGKTYDGSAYTGVSVTYVKGSHDISENATFEYFKADGTSLGSTAPSDAGTYKVAMTWNNATTDKNDANASFTIATATITSVTLKEPTVLTYTGNPQTVEVDTVKAGDLTVPTTGYTVSGNTQTDPGNYQVTVTGTGNYTGTAPASWQIKAHEHDFNCVVGDGKFTVTCNNSSTCTIPGGTSLEIICENAGKVYDGTALTATIVDNTPSPYTFATYTSGSYTEITWDDASANAGNHTATFKATVNGVEYTISKTFTIEKKSIEGATMTLSATSFAYTGTDKTVTITSVKIGDFDVTYTEDADSVRTTKAIGTHTVKITANGNFTGAATANWTITNYSGSLKSVAAAESGVGTLEGTTLTVTDSSKFEYDSANQVWYVGLTLTWYMDKGDNSYLAWEDSSKGYAVYTRPQDAQITVEGATFTGAQSGTYDGGKIDNATATLTYYKNMGNSKNRTYLNTTTWRVKVTPAIVEAAKSAGLITDTMYAGALPFSDDDNPESSPGIAFQNYTINIPIDENLKLYDEVGNQVYPAKPYVAQVADTKKKYLTLADALTAATAGQTVNAIANCEAGTFSLAKNVTLNLGGYGNAEASYTLDADKDNMTAKVASSKAESVSAVSGFVIVPNTTSGYVYTLAHAHVHSWLPSLNGPKLTITCDNNESDCKVTDRTTYLELQVTDNGEGTAPTCTIENQDAFLGIVNEFETLASVGSVTIERTEGDGASRDKWYVGKYRATCTVTLNGTAYTLTNDFKIAKPAEYTTGWEVASRGIRYDSWDEAFAALADTDTIYYRDGDRKFETHDFSVGDKDLTIDFGGATLTKESKTTLTLKNTGSGTLTFQNVVIKQPGSSDSSVKHIEAVGNIVFGDSVTVQTRSTSDWCTITSTSGKLSVVGFGIYQCKFAENGGEVEVSNGYFWYNTNCKPTSGVLKDSYIVREVTVESTQFYQVVYHEHHVAYSASGNVVSAVCDTNDCAYCGYGTKKATLNAPEKQDDGQPYAAASISYDTDFPDQTVTADAIVYKNSNGETISAPSTFGTYTAEVTIGGVTAVKEFTVIHTHNFEYNADDEADTITARCTTTDACDFNSSKRIATLNANNGTYTGFGQDLASTSVNTSDFPAEVALTYSCDGQPTAAGDYTATMTVGGVSVTKSFSIAKASMSGVTITLSGSSMDYTGSAQGVSISSVKFGDYTLVKDVDYTIDESSVLQTAGSGATDTTSTIKIIGMGNFADEEQTASWKITAPTRDFESVSQTLGGTLSGSTLTMAGADWTYYAADSAPDGSGIAGWYAGMRLKWPVATLQYTRGHKALHTLSTNPGEQLWGDELSSVIGLSAEVESSISDDGCMKYTYWYTRLTPELAEACGDENFVRTMTASGLTWSEKVLGVSYGDSEGVREVTCTITQPMEGLVLTVPSETTYDLGATVLDKCSLKLAKDAQVTTTVEQDESKITTDEVGFQIYSGTEGGVTTYACWTATEYVTVPNVTHATKVVKVGEEVKQPTEEGGEVYEVLYGDTVTVTYTPEIGYETEDGTKTAENVTEDTAIAAATVTPISYNLSYLDAATGVAVVEPATYTIESASPFVLPEIPARENCASNGWLTAKDGTEGVASFDISAETLGDKVFYARYTVTSVPISDDPDAPVIKESAELTEFIESVVTNAADSTENIMNQLKEEGANHIPVIDSYVLGLDPKEETSVPTVLPVQTAKVGELTLKAGNIAPKTDVGATVTYKLQTSSSPDFGTVESTTEEQSSGTFEGVELPESGVKYYRIQVEVK